MSNKPLVLKPINGEPRILDIDLAEKLGFDRPADIRKLIKRYEEKLNKFSILATVAKIHEGAGRPSDEFYLNRKQAAFICMKSETDNAFEVQVEIIEVFDAYQNGAMKSQIGKTPSVGEYAMLSARALMEHEHRLDMQDHRIDGMTSEIAKLKAVIIQPSQPTHDLFSPDLPIRNTVPNHNPMPEGYWTVPSYIKAMDIKIVGKRCGMISRHCGKVCKNRNIPVMTPNPVDQPTRHAYPREVIEMVLAEEIKLSQGKGDSFRAYLQEGVWVKQRLLATRMKWGQSKVRVSYLLEKMGFLFRLPNGNYLPTEKAVDICREDEDGELQWKVIPIKKAYDAFTQKFQPRKV